MIGMDFVHGRDVVTHMLLAGTGARSRLAPDLALLTIPTVEPGVDSRVPSSCIVTGGVLAGGIDLERIFRDIRAVGLNPTYLRVGDGGEGPRVEQLCLKSGVPLVEANAFDSQTLLQYLSSFQIAVSGRHHINLFLLAAGTPFVPIPSNTRKIEASLADLHYDVPVARSYEEVKAFAQVALSRDDRARRNQIDLFRAGKEKAVRIGEEISAWTR
jgi:hypothetical protein